MTFDTVTHPTVWTSADTGQWTQITLPHQPNDFLTDVTAGGPGFVAVGSTQPRGSANHQAIIWTSADGYEWTRHMGESIDDIGARSSGIDHIVTGEGILFAAGWQDIREPQAVPVHWVTPAT